MPAKEARSDASSAPTHRTKRCTPSNHVLQVELDQDGRAARSGRALAGDYVPS